MSLVSGSKGHHGVKRASNYHPWMLNMTTCTDHQLFILGEKLWTFLSVLEVGHLSLFTTFKKQFGLGRWKRGPPRIEHSIHSNFPPLNISLLDSSLFLTIYNDSYSFITTYVYRYINIYLKTLCLMLCMEFCQFDLHEGKRCGKFYDLGALEMCLLTLQHVFNLSSLLIFITRLLERICPFWQNLSSQLTTWKPGRFCK